MLVEVIGEEMWRLIHQDNQDLVQIIVPSLKIIDQPGIRKKIHQQSFWDKHKVVGCTSSLSEEKSVRTIYIKTVLLF